MTQVSQSSEVCTEYVRKLIRVKAWQLCRRSNFCSSDMKDVEQHLYLHLLTQIEKFDRSRASLNTFSSRVVDSAAAMLLRERQREKRTPEEGTIVQSLGEMVDQPDGPPAPLGTTLSRADVERRTGGKSMSGIELFELAEDIAHLISTLPPELQSVCRALMYRNRSETESDLGLSRRRYDAALELIRQHFAYGGFAET